MLLSVIVPVYGTEPYLRGCLESLLDQGIPPDRYEVIVVDDGSPDDSVSIANAVASEHPNVVIHRQENRGLSGARNTGLDLARGRFVWFVDSDDYVARDSLGWMLDIVTREDLDVLAFGFIAVDLTTDVADPPPPGSVAPTVMSGVDYIARNEYVSGVWSYLFDRAYLQRLAIRFEEGRILEDLVFTSTAVSEAARLAHVPVAVYRYVKRPGSIMEMRGTEHTRRVTADWEHAITGLDQLRVAWATRAAPVAFLERLAAMEQRFVFFLIARFIRSEIPLSPTLTDALERFRALGMYPFDRFPSGHFRRGVRYRLLARAFSRGWSLRACAAGVRLGARVMRRARR